MSRKTKTKHLDKVPATNLSGRIVNQPEHELAAAALKQADKLEVIALVVAVKAWLFLLAGQAYQVLENKTLTGLSEWAYLWHHWDALHYQKLAEFGYNATGELRSSMVFYPLYPWLIRVLTWLTRDYVVSALIISTICSVIVAVVFFKLISLDYPRDVALRAVWFLLIFPTSYFLHIGYTESLFLTLALSSIYLARTERFLGAGILGALACLTRANGLILVPVLAVEFFQQYRKTRHRRVAWLWILLIPLGFGGYLAVNYYAAGDTWAFITIRRDAFSISLAPPWVGIMAALGQMGHESKQAEMFGVQELIFILLGFVGAVVSWFKLRPSYSVWITCSWLLVVSVSFIASIPRYTLTMFPIFLLFAMLAKRHFWLAILSAWSLLYLAFFATQFAWGRWAF